MSVVMRNVLFGAALSLTVVAIAAAIPGQAPAPASVPADPLPAFAYSEPGISPDGREIAFSSRGDIWSVPATGGEARLLVADAATDRRPMFSPDGRTLAFVSTRTGGGDIYTLALDTGVVKRLTWDDGLDELNGWSPDGRWIYFSAAGRDIAAMNDVFRVSVRGGTPLSVTGERYVNEFGAAPAPDGRTLAFVARGIASNQWWRRGSSHIDQSELWTIDLAGDEPRYAQIVARGARVMWPMWAGTDSALFYVSDRGGVENIWSRPASPRGSEKQITAFGSGRVLWPTITRDGRTFAFERVVGIWTVETASGRTRSLVVTRRGASTAPTPERVRQTNQFTDLALSPDGRKVAFIAHGDVYAASARDGGDAARVTTTRAIESQPAWAPDSRRLVYVSRTREGQQLHLHDFATGAHKAMTSGVGSSVSPVFES